MTFDWNTGNQAEFAFKLVVWLVWSLAAVALETAGHLPGMLERAGYGQIAIALTIGLLSIWLVIRLIKLLVIGGLVSVIGVLAMHLLQA